MSELLEQMKLLNEDHTPGGYPAVKMSEINELIEIIEKKSDQLAKANERVVIYKRGINKAIEAIEREDDSSAYDAISYLENALQLRKEQD